MREAIVRGGLLIQKCQDFFLKSDRFLRGRGRTRNPGLILTYSDGLHHRSVQIQNLNFTVSERSKKKNDFYDQTFVQHTAKCCLSFFFSFWTCSGHPCGDSVMLHLGRLSTRKTAQISSWEAELTLSRCPDAVMMLQSSSPLPLPGWTVTSEKSRPWTASLLMSPCQPGWHPYHDFHLISLSPRNHG